MDRGQAKRMIVNAVADAAMGHGKELDKIADAIVFLENERDGIDGVKVENDGVSWDDKEKR